MRAAALIAALGLLLLLAPAEAQAPTQSPAPAQAGDDAVRLDLARQIVATRSEAGDMRVFQANLPFFMAQIGAVAHLSDGERALLPQKLEQEYRSQLPRVREHRAATYARLFSTEELRQVLAFYSSEAGRTFLAHQEEVTQDGIDLQHALNAAVLTNVAQWLADERAATHP